MALRRAVVALFVLLAVGAFWLGWVAAQSAGRTEAVACFGVGMVFSALGIWVARRRVVLYPEGLSYSSLLGEKTLRWDNIVRFYWQGSRQSVNFIPVGTYYWLRLVDSQGQKVRFGSGLARTGSLATKLIELTRGPLLKRIASEFDGGIDVDFGPIRINRQTGITKKSALGRTKSIPWSEVRAYRIQDGHLYIWRIGEKRTTGYRISSVPNAFALLALLDIVFEPQSN